MIFAEDIPSAVSRAQCERLADLAAGNVVLEVGSEYGRSTIALASTAQIVHAVDWHRGDQMSGFKDSLPTFWANLQRYGVRDNVVVHVGAFEQVAKVFSFAAFDLVFIDGDHSADAARRDALLAYGLVKPDGVVIFHDADQSQVMEAVHLLAGFRRFPPTPYPTEYGPSSLAAVRLTNQIPV